MAIDPTTSAESVQSASASSHGVPTASVTATAGASAAAAASAGQKSAGSVTFTTVEQFRLEYPELYNAFMQSMVYAWTGQQNRSNERIARNLRDDR